MKPGDTVTVPLSVEIRYTESGWAVDAPEGVETMLPKGNAYVEGERLA